MFIKLRGPFTIKLVSFTFIENPSGNYIFKVNNRNTRAWCEICLKLTTKTPERRQWHISHLVLVFLLLTLSRWMTARNNKCSPPISYYLQLFFYAMNAVFFLVYQRKKLAELELNRHWINMFLFSIRVTFMYNFYHIVNISLQIFFDFINKTLLLEQELRNHLYLK